MATETIITKMFIENTGTNLCDSGGKNGRHWQQNRINGINTMPIITDHFESIQDKEMYLLPMKPAYNFLYRYLNKSVDARKIEEEFYFSMDIDDIYNVWIMQDTLKKMGSIKENPYIGGYEVINTYNQENTLSQDIQFILFEYDYEDYILLQVHNGADARAGYTRPQIFKIEYIEKFITAINTAVISCSCKNNHYFYNSYNDLSDPRNGAKINFKRIWDKTYIDTNYNLRCKKCKGLLYSFEEEAPQQGAKKQ